MDDQGYEELGDEDLMRHIARGDRRAFDLLARRSVPPAVGLARRVLGNTADAEEVVQEAMLRVWVNAPSWRPEARFRTWLYRIVLNLCLNRRRRPAMAPLDVAGDPIAPEPDASVQMEWQQRDRAIADAIAALPERQRAAIVLTYHEGLGNAETADMLGTSVSAVETLLVRAKQALRRTLGPLIAENAAGD